MARLVSILIDNYNYGRFLRQAIDSALGQTYPQVEVVVVDDGSTDESREIIASYGDRIRPVLKDNGGMASAFNAGLPATRGEIVAFLDSDDYLHPGAMARIAAAWTEETRAVHHRLRRVDAGGRPIGFDPPADVTLDSGDVLPILLRRGFYGAPPTSGLAYRRDFLLPLLPIPEEAFRRCAESYFVFLTPFLAPVTAIEGTLACYRVHGGNDYARGRRFWDRARLAHALANVELRKTFIREAAAARGLPVPPPEAWEEAAQIFQHFLFAASDPAGGRVPAAGWMGRLLRRLRTERLPAKEKARLLALGLLVGFGPHGLKRRIYPNLFDV